ncbi:hypothetical protein NSP_1220 [Nodularia spumigena CCY9414]|nr:hypothetical protein NSP_1220 [Nodularia spumigena CCY9414]
MKRTVRFIQLFVGGAKIAGVAESEYEMPKLPFFFFLPLRLPFGNGFPSGRCANAECAFA